MSTPAQTSRQRFLTWFHAWWAGDDPEDQQSVPSTGDWMMYSHYERTMSTAWAAWQASEASRAA